MNKKTKIIALLLALCLLAGCSSAAEPEDAAYIDLSEVKEAEIESEAVALSSSPAAVPTLLLPEASGTAVKKNEKAIIDYSNIADGYVMARFTASSDKRLVAQTAGPSTTYTYNLTAGEWATFPLSDGNGTYKVTVLENVADKKYAVVLSASIQVTLKDEFAPFLRPNQYVDYETAPKTVEKAAELTRGVTEPLTKVEKIYDFVVKNLSYDKAKAQTVKTGYLPALDDVLAALAVLAAVCALWEPGRAGLLSLWRGRWGDRGVSRKLNDARLAQALAMGIAGGLPLEEALDLAAGLLEGGARARCQDCRRRIEEREGLGEALRASDLLPLRCCRLFELGQRGGAGDTAMEKIALSLMEEGEAALESLVGRVEPSLVLVCSLLVGLILLSVMLPLMNIMAAVG